jgi:hypothetical protein
VADRAAPAGGPAFAAGLGAGRGQLEPAGGAAGDPDAAQQMQGRLRRGLGRVGLGVHPRDLLEGLVVREAGTGRIRPGLTRAGALERGVVVEVAALALAAMAARLGLAMAQRSDGATSSASTSTTDRLSPSGVSQLRLLSRPMTTARSPGVVGEVAGDGDVGVGHS